MRLLVCGGAGFIGSDFVRRMLAKHADWEIVCFDRLTYAGNLDNLLPVAQDPRYSFVHGDIGNHEEVEGALALSGGVDAIVNFAAETHVDRSIAEPEAFLHTDILGTHTLLEIVREHDIAKMVQVSTDEVYGSIAEGSFCETDRINPSSPYSASKAGGDLQVLAYHTTYGTPALITRGSNTYGPYQYPEKLIPLFVTNAIEGGKLPLYGDGMNVRDWLHADDHADGIEAALLRGMPGQVYNIGGGNERTNRAITQIILDELGLSWDDHVEQVADRPGHDRRYSIACDKAHDELDWQPTVDFEAGLRDTIRWYRENEWWWSKIKHHTDEFADWHKRWYEERGYVADRHVYLIAGGGGMLGTALQRVLSGLRVRFVAPSERDFDITDEALVAMRVAELVGLLRAGERGVLVNAAAYTNVERAEDDPDTAYRVNELGARMLAAAARQTGLRFVHVSTDFVFDGTKQGAYTEADEPNPLSVYGASKLAGEQAVFAEDPDAIVARTAWVFGPGGANFPLKIVEAAHTRPALQVVTDEIGSPTYTVDLANALVGLVDAGASGLFHLAGSGSCNRFELARETLALAGLADVELEPVTSDLFPTKAARPHNSVLDCSKAAELGVTMPEWSGALARFLGDVEGRAS